MRPGLMNRDDENTAQSNPYLRSTLVDSLGSGGKVRQAPGRGGAITDAVGGTGVGIAQQAAGVGAGAALGGVSMATDYLGGKLKPKEQQPTYGGEFGQYTDQFGRRFEGAGPGIKGGMVRGAGYGAMVGGAGAIPGAIIGGLVGAFTKNAPTAYSDFRNEDAASAIGALIKNEMGRDASPEEIATHLANQGSKPGDRWVGQDGLNFVLGQLRNSEEAKAYAARQSMLEQLGTGDGPATATGPAYTNEGNEPFAAVPMSVEAAQAQGKATEAAQQQARAKFNADTQRLAAEGWDGRPETSGGRSLLSQPSRGGDVARPYGIMAPADPGGLSGSGGAGYDGSGINPRPFDPAGLTTADGSAAGAPAAAGGVTLAPPGTKAPPGWDQGKVDRGHSSPKYAALDNLQGLSAQLKGIPDEAARKALAEETLRGMIPELEAAGGKVLEVKGEKVLFDANDGKGPLWIDTIKDIEGAAEPQWLGENTTGGAATGAGSGDAAGAGLTADALGAASDGDLMAQIMAEIRRIQSGEPDRAGLLAQLGQGA